MDSDWAEVMQELIRPERRYGFQAILEVNFVSPRRLVERPGFGVSFRSVRWAEEA